MGSVEAFPRPRGEGEHFVPLKAATNTELKVSRYVGYCLPPAVWIGSEQFKVLFSTIADNVFVLFISKKD